MLGSKNRLTSESDISEVKRKAKRFNSKNFILLHLNNNKDSVRFGFLVSKKVSKLAVKRNRLKRQFREAVKLVLSDMRPGFDYLFIIKRQALDLDSKSIFSEVESALSSVNSKE